MSLELKARPNGCEEAALISQGFYIPCNISATRNIYHSRDKRTYRMCDMCADHNVKRRGAEDQGPYTPTDTEEEPTQ